MKSMFLRSGAVLGLAAGVAVAMNFSAVDTADAASKISKVPHIMAADNVKAWENATPTTCRGVRFDRVGKSDSPRYIFQNDGIESVYAGKESTCIPVSKDGNPDSKRAVVVDKDSAVWQNAEETYCTDVRFMRGGSDGDTVYWVFSSRAAVYNDLSTCTKTDSGNPFTR